MRLNHAIKKIAAVGTGAMLLGMSAAAAVDLSDYPRPFIEQGEFSGSLVVGENALGIDTVGMTEIAMSLQAAATLPVHGDGDVTETILEDSFRVRSGSNDLLYAGMLNLKPTLTEDDLSILSDVTFRDNDGRDYDAQFRIGMPNAPIRFEKSLLDSGEDPTFYVDFSDQATWNFDITFPDGVNFDDFKGERIHILGEEYVFGQGDDVDHDAGKLTLYKSGVERVVSAGSPETITVDGEPVTIEVRGANPNADPPTATLRIAGQQEPVREGRFYTIGGVRIFVDAIFIDTVPEDRAEVRVFVGADKLIFRDGQRVERSDGSKDETVHGVTASFTGDFAGGNDVTRIRLTYRPDDHRALFSPVVNRNNEFLALGDEYVDPVFEQIKFAFTDRVPAMTSAQKEFITLRGGNRINLVVSNYNGVEYDMTVLSPSNNDAATGMANVTWSYDYTARAGRGERVYVFGGNGHVGTYTSDYTVLQEDNRFIVRENLDSRYTRFVEVIDIDPEPGATETSSVTLLDLGTGDDVTWQTTSGEMFSWDDTATFNSNASGAYQYGEYTYDGVDYGFVINPVDGYVVLVNEVYVGNDLTNLTARAVGNEFVTRRGGVLQFTDDGSNSELLHLQEDSDFNADNPRDNEHGQLTFAFSWDGDDLEVNGVTYARWNGSAFVADTTGDYWSLLVDLESNDDVSSAVTVYGTAVSYDSDRGNADIFYPRERVTYNVFVGPASAGTGVGGGEGTIVGEAINPIAVGAAILDTEAAALVGTSNLIVVGGPCANDVAAELMGMPAECWQDFTVGEGRIKLFENPNGTVSLLVAGATGADTRLAARVLASYAQHEGRLVGDEVVVTGTTIANVDISAPVRTEDDFDEDDEE